MAKYSRAFKVKPQLGMPPIVSMMMIKPSNFTGMEHLLG
jgi:hypothetical protein